LLTSSNSPVPALILNRLSDVCGLDFLSSGEVGYGAVNPEDPAVGAGASAQLVDGRFEKLLCVIIRGKIALDAPICGWRECFVSETAAIVSCALVIDALTNDRRVAGYGFRFLVS